jgi:hypothetical protein
MNEPRKQWPSIVPRTFTIQLGHRGLHFSKDE